MPKEKVQYQPITSEQVGMVSKLSNCTFLPGSFDKLFVRGLNGADKISERQASYLVKLFYKYRKQIAGQ